MPKRNKNKFNPNITPANHAGCIISAQAKRDKTKYMEDNKKGLRPVKVIVSNANGMFK